MQIHNELLELRKNENLVTAQILEKLQIMENTRDYLKLGHSSLFDYLVRGLSYSDSTAYQRQCCVRLSREIPELKEKIDQGKLSYTTVTMAYKSIKNKSSNEKREALSAIENKSSREVKKIFLEPAKPIKIKQQVYQDKVVLRLELSHEQNEKIQKLKRLQSHKHGSSANESLESLFEGLIDKELKKYESTEFKPSQSENPRQIPRRLSHYLLKKANYKCEFPNCEETHFLQVDHIRRVRHGGKANAENLRILCAAHNRWRG